MFVFSWVRAFCFKILVGEGARKSLRRTGEVKDRTTLHRAFAFVHRNLHVQGDTPFAHKARTAQATFIRNSNNRKRSDEAVVRSSRFTDVARDTSSVVKYPIAALSWTMEVPSRMDFGTRMRRTRQNFNSIACVGVSPLNRFAKRWSAKLAKIKVFKCGLQFAPLA